MDFEEFAPLPTLSALRAVDGWDDPCEGCPRGDCRGCPEAVAAGLDGFPGGVA